MFDVHYSLRLGIVLDNQHAYEIFRIRQQTVRIQFYKLSHTNTTIDKSTIDPIKLRHRKCTDYMGIPYASQIQQSMEEKLSTTICQYKTVRDAVSSILDDKVKLDVSCLSMK
jgi:hypothetical protein